MDDGTDGWIDGWKKLHEKQPRCPLLYVMFPNNPTFVAANEWPLIKMATSLNRHMEG
jgi:hypothetical protein